MTCKEQVKKKLVCMVYNQIESLLLFIFLKFWMIYAVVLMFGFGRPFIAFYQDT